MEMVLFIFPVSDWASDLSLKEEMKKKAMEADQHKALLQEKLKGSFTHSPSR